jgi:hypothetical protein
MMPSAPLNLKPSNRDPQYASSFSRTNTNTDLKKMQAPQGFSCMVQPQYLEEIMKATFVRDVLVEVHFEKYSTGIGNQPKSL